MIEKIIDQYNVKADDVAAKIDIKQSSNEFVPTYNVVVPEIEKGTAALLDKVKESLIAQIPIKSTEIVDLSLLESLKKRLYTTGLEMLKKELPSTKEDVLKYLISMIVHDMIGLGKFEIILEDPNIEEISINNSAEPAWIYHKKYGWMKTNLKLEKESDIFNLSSAIGRRIGRQISVLTPLMDAHLPTGDRVNSTLFPISTKGNTISIRKFRRQPLTITDLIEYKTINLEVAAFLWFGVQYEMNMIISGGTASGKTSLLNVLMAFIQPNHRVISIEDTRELLLPNFLHWVPLNTREPNPEGKGEVTMLDLLVNSLRMRPDRIIVGEVRRAREAEVLFEAMHTGHSVYATLHADTAGETFRRLVNPPINVPKIMLESLHLIVSAFRDRRTGRRRIFEVGEVLVGGNQPNIIYRWRPVEDVLTKYSESQRVVEDLKLFTGMSSLEINQNLREKEQILEWFVKNKVNSVNDVGRVVANYYIEPEKLVNSIKANLPPSKILSYS